MGREGVDAPELRPVVDNERLLGNLGDVLCIYPPQFRGMLVGLLDF